MASITERLGTVLHGSFVLFPDKKGVPDHMRIGLRLTRAASGSGQSPEEAEIDLHPYEGQVLLVRGQLGGAWLHSAEILDAAGPILSLLAQKVYS